MRVFSNPRSARARPVMAAALLAAAFAANGAAGDLDLTFGPTGVVFVGPTVESPLHWATPYKRNSVMSAVVSGVPGSRITRVYHTLENGGADATFGTGGFALLPGTMDEDTVDIGFDKRDRVLLALQGATSQRVHRLTTAGLADATFGTGGVVQFAITDPLGVVRILAQRDRKILVVSAERNAATGTQDLSVRRLNENGALDATFGAGGVFRWQGPGPSTRTWGAGVGLQSDGRIIVSGRYTSGGGAYTGYVLRLTTSGGLDPTFGTAGHTAVVWTPGNVNSARHVVVMGDDRIVTGGGSYDLAGANGAAALARLTVNGAFDVTFGSGGKTLYPMPAFGGSWFHLGVASNDKVVLGGFKSESATDPNVASGNILRFRENGVIDTSFAGDGSFEYAPTSPPLVGGAQAFVDNDDRPIGVFSQLTSAAATTANPVLVRLEAGKKSCP